MKSPVIVRYSDTGSKDKLGAVSGRFQAGLGQGDPEAAVSGG